MAASEENKLLPSFSGFKSKKILHESSYDVVSGTDNDKRRALIIEDEFKILTFADYCKPSYL